MSLFYGNEKNNDNPYPNISNVRQQNNNNQHYQAQDNTFKSANNQSQNNLRNSVFLKKDEVPATQPGCCEKCCSCFTIEYYKEYFKVTNADVKKRVLSNLKFWSGNFFKPLQQDYDLYGPFWIYTTLVFLASAVQNIIFYQTSNNIKNFSYNYTVIGSAMTIFYLLGLGLSALLGLIFGCLGLQTKTIQIVSLYGYSMFIYIICMALCIINVPGFRWLFLLYACGSKIGFILRSIFEGLDVPAAKKIAIIAIVIIQAALQFFIIKFMFIKSTQNGLLNGAFSHMQAVPQHDMQINMLHLRNYLL